jgi:hypothetical protein
MATKTSPRQKNPCPPDPDSAAEGLAGDAAAEEAPLRIKADWLFRHYSFCWFCIQEGKRLRPMDQLRMFT